MFTCVDGGGGGGGVWGLATGSVGLKNRAVDPELKKVRVSVQRATTRSKRTFLILSLFYHTYVHNYYVRAIICPVSKYILSYAG
jgi:hypothetical protein